MQEQNEVPGIFVRTFTKRRINLLAIEPEDIDIHDIAHHMSLQNRFLGATPHAYSTAQHSVHLVTMISKWGVSTETMLQGLLHDSEEAYLGDIITPVKRDRRAAPMAELGNNVRGSIMHAFGLPRILANDIKVADNMMCAIEIRDLMGEDPRDWGLMPAPAGKTRLQPWPAWLAKQRFLGEFNRLRNIFHQEREEAHAPF